MGEKFSRREFFKKAGIAGITTVGMGIVGDGLFNLFGEEAEAAANSTLSVATAVTRRLWSKEQSMVWAGSAGVSKEANLSVSNQT